MEPERWQRISGIFKSALALEPEERAEYVAAKCGPDESLRDEVQKLIDSHQQASEQNFIESAAVAEAAPLFPLDDEADAAKDRLQKNQLISHYRVIQKLGEGGMGEVYLVEDTALGRTVALKILPEEVAADKRRMGRFKQEAKLASSLNQPNILTIFEFGEVDSLHFIVSEYVDGLTLREYLHTRDLKLPEIIDICAQVLAALDAAHEARIVHRDIKPENIMVRRRDKVVKVLDFGLAKLAERRTLQSSDPASMEANTELLVRTMPGAVMGTVHYMSPEHAQGLQVDERTDLWSIAVVMYELIAGRVPFAGVTSSHTVVDILEKEPAPLTTNATRAAPPELQRIISKALAKNPDERYQTAKDMLIDLRNLKKRLELDVEIQRSFVGGDVSRSSTSEDSIEAATREWWRNGKLVAATGVGLVVVSLAIIGTWLWRRPAAVVTSPPAAAVSERKLSYWLTVQKYRNGKPFENPFRLASEINFEKDYQVKLNVSTQQGGYLYVVNEGPPSHDSTSPFLILFPSSTANEGQSYLAQNRTVEIPEDSGDWFKFDAEEGTEKLWLIFSAQPVPELEAIKQFANRKDKGVIKDSSLEAGLRRFLESQSASKPKVEKDDDLKETNVTAAGPVLAHIIKLEHH